MKRSQGEMVILQPNWKPNIKKTFHWLYNKDDYSTALYIQASGITTKILAIFNDLAADVVKRDFIFIVETYITPKIKLPVLVGPKLYKKVTNKYSIMRDDITGERGGVPVLATKRFKNKILPFK